MRKQLKGWLAAVAIALFSLALPAQAQALAGGDYALVDPAVPSDTPAKIEVIEFFSYGCPHCSDLNPHASKWAAKLPADVVLRRIPVGFGNPYYQIMARLYYALEAIGEVKRLDQAVFTAIHDKGLKLIDDKSILEWVTAQGVDAKTFSDAYNSFGVISKTKRADQISQAAKIRGVPALVVDGRYMVTGKDIKGFPELLALTDKVIGQSRSERNKK
jgi:thiol:disulfide interchange protein DsbA